MTATDPAVSVVIPAYRAEAFVARAIQSVLDQPGVDPEIIVVVDGLVDRTADIARGFPKTRVVINEVNRGAPEARNRGLALARAPYVMFLRCRRLGRRGAAGGPYRGIRRVSC